MFMRKWSFLVLAAVPLLTIIAQDAAFGAQGIVQTSRGLYRNVAAPCVGEACVGNLVTCPEGTLVSREFERITSLAGVCDDTDPANRCGGGDLTGRLTVRTERCTLQNSGNANLTGLMFSVLSRGQSRTCFDSTGVSDCSDPLPDNVVVIRESDVMQQERWVFVPQQQSPSGELQRSESQVSSKVVPTATAPFIIDGRSVELEANVLTVTKTWQADPDEDNCAAVNVVLGSPPGCGAASVAVAETGPSCCGDCNGDGKVKVDELVTGVNKALKGCPAQ